MLEHQIALEKQLLLTADFLQLTCQHPLGLPRLHFDLITDAQHTTKVSVIDTGIILFEPDCATSSDILLSAGVHGNETAPIELLNQLIKAIIERKIILKQRVMFIFANPPAIKAGQRFVEENLNRLFCGRYSVDGGMCNDERKRAYLLEKTTVHFFDNVKSSDKRARIHYDLHTSILPSKYEKFALHPFNNYQPYNQQQLAFLQACDINTVLFSQAPTPSFAYFTLHECQANSFTLELGQIAKLGHNDLSKLAQLKDQLTSLITEKPVARLILDKSCSHFYEVAQIINRTSENFQLNIPADTANFTEFPLGFTLAADGDTQYQIEEAGEASLFVNANVGIGQRALLTVKPITDIEFIA